MKKNKSFKRNPSLLNPEYKIITNLEPSSSASEAYRRIKVALDFAAIDNDNRVIQICSSISSEGKTTTLLNIAAAYAESKKKVVVVDLDLRKPRCHRAFKVENKDGLNDVLLGNVELSSAIKHSETLGFDLLNSGKKTSNISYVIASNQLKSVIEELKKIYDIVLIDCPPVLAFSDAVVISSFCDAALFIVSQLRTDRKTAKEGIKILKENNVNIIGCVFTEISNKKSMAGHYYYNSYYGYSQE